MFDDEKLLIMNIFSLKLFAFTINIYSPNSNALLMLSKIFFIGSI